MTIGRLVESFLDKTVSVLVSQVIVLHRADLTGGTRSAVAAARGSHAAKLRRSSGGTHFACSIGQTNRNQNNASVDEPLDVIIIQSQ